MFRYLLGKFGAKREKSTAPRVFSVPRGVRVYAFGDTHGCESLLRALADKITKDSLQKPVEKTIVIGLGDYIDRGPDSKGVIDALLEEDLFGDAERVFLKGNHEAFLLSFLKDPERGSLWLEYGGREMLQSYGIKPPFSLSAVALKTCAAELAAALPETHLSFFNNLKLSHTIGDYFFVHAGARPDLALSEQSERDLLMIREPFLTSKKPFEKKIVHGHTPKPEPEILPNRMNLDTGAYLTGRLSAVALQGDGYYML